MFHILSMYNEKRGPLLSGDFCSKIKWSIGDIHESIKSNTLKCLWACIFLLTYGKWRRKERTRKWQYKRKAEAWKENIQNCFFFIKIYQFTKRQSIVVVKNRFWSWLLGFESRLCHLHALWLCLNFLILKMRIIIIVSTLQVAIRIRLGHIHNVGRHKVIALNDGSTPPNKNKLNMD